MELDELKSNWKNSGNKTKSQSELLLMTKINNHPKLKRIRTKLIIETLLLVAFLLVYNDVFDGDSKPLWVNVCLLASALLFILNDAIGYFTLQNPITEKNMAKTTVTLLVRLKRQAILSVVTSLFFGLSTIVFLTSTIYFTRSKYFILAGILLMLMVMIYISAKNWLYRISHVERTVKQFE